MGESDPFGTIFQIGSAYVLSRCLHIVADLGLADLLDETPRPATELAAAAGANPDALARTVRLLAAHGVFTLADGAIGHTPASRLLRGDHPQSLRAFVSGDGIGIGWEVFGSLGHTLRTGQPALPEVYPAGLWDYLARNPAAGRSFDAAMAAKAHGQITGVLATYDFSGCAVLGDIAGGSGHLLRAILDAAPQARGILFDLPPVIAAASGLASSRLTLQAGDFFRDPLPACDSYLLLDVLHDWPDAEALAILRAIRAAAPPGARVLLIESLLPDHDGPDGAKLLDIIMMVNHGGRQRTVAEFAALLAQAGFRLARTIDAGAGTAIVEAIAIRVALPCGGEQ